MERSRICVWLLRLGGIATVAAFPTMLMPTAWMAGIHEWLGLGAYPDAPLTSYLSRSIAGLYGFHGVLMLLVSTDVRRYAPIVVYLGTMNVLFGLMMLAVDLDAGMPWWWTAGEGPPIVAMGAALLAVRPRD